MGKKITDSDLDNIEIIGDSGDDLSDVKRQLKKLKKESEDLDEEGEEVGVIEEDDNDAENIVNDDIVINEENSLPFNDEDRYYKSLDKFLKENPKE
jgi:hypothetical protein